MTKIQLILIACVVMVFNCNCFEEDNLGEISLMLDNILMQKNASNQGMVDALVKQYVILTRINKIFKEKRRKKKTPKNFERMKLIRF